MQPIDNSQKRKRKLWIYIALFVMLSACLVLCFYINQDWKQSAIAYQKEEEADALLTQEHGEEAREVVEHYEQNWMSLEMYNERKTVLNDLLTGPLLDFYIGWPASYDDPGYLLVNSGVDVKNLRVVEYDGQSMKAIACVEEETDKVARDGTFIEHLPTGEYTRFYAFILDEGSWKVANVINIDDPKKALQSWDAMSQELRDITGDFESFVTKSCEIQD